MASTFVNNLRLNELGTGDGSGTWGNTTNSNLELIGEALGFGTEAITTNADTHTTTVADGSSDAGRALFLKYTGTLDSTCTITIAPNTMKRVQFIENGTSGSQSIIISQGSGANVTIPTGQTKAIYLDGAGSGAKVVDAFVNLNLGGTTTVDDLTVGGDIDLEGDIDVNGTMEADAITINGTAIGSVLSPIAGSYSIVTTGALNAGSITSGFGTIDTGSSTITTTGTVATGAITAGGNLTRGGTVILDGSITDTGDFTIDVVGDIILDAGGDDVKFHDSGTLRGFVSMVNTDLTIQSSTQDRDIIFKGDDGGSAITALTLDMSGAGAATFNNDVTAFSDKRLKTDISNIENGLDKVMQMQGVYYKRNDIEDAREQIGVLAQDMEAIMPEIVLTADDDMQTKSVDYGKLTSVLIEAIKELKIEIDELKKG